MTFCLTTTIIKPEKDASINQAVILLHGYGGDGKDISMLTLNWKRFLPNTIFFNKEGKEFARIIGSINFSDKEFINWLKSYN